MSSDLTYETDSFCSGLSEEPRTQDTSSKNLQKEDTYQLTWSEAYDCQFQDEDGVVVIQTKLMQCTLMFTNYDKAVQMLMSLPSDINACVCLHDQLDIPVWNGRDHLFRPEVLDRGVDN